MKQNDRFLKVLCLVLLLLGGLLFPNFLDGSRACAASVAINETNFPDANFRSFVRSNYDKDNDKVLSDEEIASVTRMYCDRASIASLKGIEYFTALTTLYCAENQLTTLDVSGCTALTTLNCRDNQLTTLDVSGCTALKDLTCYRNQLTTLDVSGCTALKYLDCAENQLTSLDVSQNTALTTLDCSKNKIRGDQMTALVNSLPDRSAESEQGSLRVYDNETPDGNLMTRSQVEDAKAKNWKALRRDSKVLSWGNYTGYAGVGVGIAFDETNFPDENFRSFVKAKYDMDENNVLSDEEIASVTRMDCYNSSISSLKGIELFTALTELNCRENQLTSLDVSKNTALTKLYCYENQLTSLDVSGCTDLTVLRCYENQLTTLDVSKNIALTELECYQNQLTSLNVSGCTALEKLNCHTNQLSMLDVSKNTALGNLLCSQNQLTSLDVSKNPALWQLSCGDNQLTSLDVSKNRGLSGLYCNGNQLTTLDVSQNTALGYLYCSGNQLTTLDVSKNKALTTLDCSKNKIRGDEMTALIESLPDRSAQSRYGELRVYNFETPDGNLMTPSQVETATAKKWKSQRYDGDHWVDYAGYVAGGVGIAIDETNFPDANFRSFVSGKCDKDANNLLSDEEIASVTRMDCDHKSIASLKGIEYFTALATLYCYENQLNTLDLSQNTALTYLCCYKNQLTSLDLSKNTALTSLFCNDNQLTTLDVSGCTALTRLDCYENQLTSLDVSGCTALTALYCRDNQLTTLDVSGCTALTDLTCTRNQLTTLDVSGCTALTYLDCYENQLTSLDVSQNTALAYLYCYENQLTTLDVSGCTALTYLSCDSNQLTTLDVSGCTALTTLGCYKNKIRGDGMTALVNSLPDRSAESKQGNLYVYDDETPTGNVMTPSQVEAATAKDWKVLKRENEKWVDYAGDEVVVVAAINETNFPDANFRSFVSSNYDKDNDNLLSDEEIASVTKMPCNSLSIASLKGIEYFTALALLSCSSNQLTSLDLSQNTALATLYCNSSQLTTLDVSGCTALTTLYCTGNQLTSLDVSGCTALKYLYCNGNQLTTLDVSKNTALQRLECYSNQLTTLDVSKNTALQRLECYSNQLTTLDVSQNTALTQLSCYNNQLTTLDVSKNTALESLSCHKNQIRGDGMTALVNSLPDRSGETAQGQLRVYYEEAPDGNMMTTLQVEVATAKNWKVQMFENKKWVDYAGEEVVAIDETNFPDANFRSFVSKNYDKDKDNALSDEEIASVTMMNCNSMSIASLKGIEYFTALKQLSCNGNQLTSLDLSKNTALVKLDCGSNQLTTLDVSKNTALKQLYCYSNQLTSLDVSGCTALVSLYCYKNQIRDDQMTVLVNGLPDRSGETAYGMFEVYDDETPTGNMITTLQVEVATAKNWKVLRKDGNDWVDYAGEDTAVDAVTTATADGAWYVLDGRKLKGRPHKKGLYIHSGRRVVVK